jgi:replicative DNA helicase
MGKTALALDIAHHVATHQGKTVTILSLEMTKEQLFDRTFAGVLGVEAWKLKKGALSVQEFQGMGAAFDSMKNTRVFVDDDTDRTLTNLRSKARRQQMENGLDLLIVDYLTLIEVTDRAAGENMVQRITYISKSLKNLARELQCPIIALSQLSRACEQRSPPIPVLSDLRESGAIEQDADSVIMLYRNGYYFEDCENADLTDVYVRKNRHGPTGHIELRFNKEKMQFESIEV